MTILGDVHLVLDLGRFGSANPRSSMFPFNVSGMLCFFTCRLQGILIRLNRNKRRTVVSPLKILVPAPLHSTTCMYADKETIKRLVHDLTQESDRYSPHHPHCPPPSPRHRSQALCSS
jgi:hypothetical protein